MTVTINGSGTIGGVVVGGITSNQIGKVLQVVNATYSTNVGSTTQTYADTGLTATITPTSASSKILVLVNQTGLLKPAYDTSVNVILLRNGVSVSAQAFCRFGAGNGLTQVNLNAVASTSYLDSPATTSAVTYKTQFNNDTPLGTVYVQYGDSMSTITLMEIAA